MDLDPKGLATRRAVLGDAYVDGALAKATPFTEPSPGIAPMNSPSRQPNTRRPKLSGWKETANPSARCEKSSMMTFDPREGQEGAPDHGLWSVQ